MTDKNVALAFHERMLYLYREVKSHGYNGTRFLSMLAEHGGLETAHLLLQPTAIQYGFDQLWRRSLLHLSLEREVLRPEWAGLFSERELALAQRRLDDHDFEVQS